MKKTIVTLASLGILGAFAIPAVSATYDSNGTVDFRANNDPSVPINPLDPDPENPVKPVDPTDPSGPTDGTSGPLSIDYASSLDFGLNKISTQDEIYYARAQRYKKDDGSPDSLLTPNYVQISDNRGSNAGWTLKVKQNAQFTNSTTLNKKLTGAVITFTDPKVDSNAVGVTAPDANATITLDPAGNESLVFSAKKDAGAGTWVNLWGKVEEVTEKDAGDKDVKAQVTKDIALAVPGKTPKDAVKYSTTLTWTLSEVPGN
ncbi:MAG: WxL domain-containing protein [Streptococcaceae bacterium]|jgi:hypothetical protein|nr:WxL domain-containing protein [Streptococcaceae bacterium]